MNNLVNINLDNNVQTISLDKQYLMQSVIAKDGIVQDKLDDTIDERGEVYIPTQSQFPVCLPDRVGIPGQELTASVNGLLPNSNIHGLFSGVGGKIIVGSANSTGDGEFSFSVPLNITSGFHLLTVGVDGTALTADCVVETMKANQTLNVISPRAFQRSSQEFSRVRGNPSDPDNNFIQ